MSRSASASQRPRPRMACWRHGPLSPAASARIQPVLRRSGPSKPSRNAFADAATRSCVNNGRIRSLTARSDEAHNSNVVSSEAALIHLPSQSPQKVDIRQKIATVVLAALPFLLTHFPQPSVCDTIMNILVWWCAAMARNKVQFQNDLSEADFDALYGTEEKCRAVVIASRWPKGFGCPACGGHAYC